MLLLSSPSRAGKGPGVRSDLVKILIAFHAP
jgi:hypothetical protein